MNNLINTLTDQIKSEFQSEMNFNINELEFTEENEIQLSEYIERLPQLIKDHIEINSESVLINDNL